MADKELTLSGYTVVDFSTVVAAPSAARVLADMGTKVIKVETHTGDTTRYQDAMPTLKPESYAFTNCNSNKASVCINIKTEGGKEAFLRLLAEGAVSAAYLRAFLRIRL